MAQCGWKTWIRPVVLFTYLVGLCVALPLLCWELLKNGAQPHVEAWFAGGVFVLASLPLSLAGILQHVVHYTNPNLQRHIIRILWMVPIYALNAWFALRFPKASIYLDTCRECYEAYVIYNFMAYLLSYMNSRYPDLNVYLESKQPPRHLFPFCCIPTSQNGATLTSKCRVGVLQYTVVRPVTTIISLICELNSKYDEGDFNFISAWSYLAIINNISQLVAMFSLVSFYRLTKEELAPIKPIGKFLCIKLVVFATFWQAVLIAILVKVGVISQKATWTFYDVHDVANGLQDFAICVEMFLAAVAHYFVFSHEPFIDQNVSRGNCCFNFWSMFSIADVTRDVVEQSKNIGQGVKKKLRLTKSATSTSRTGLIDEEEGEEPSISHVQSAPASLADLPPPPAINSELSQSQDRV